MDRTIPVPVVLAAAIAIIAGLVWLIFPGAISAVWSGLAAPPAASTMASKPLRVLFIGNSFTAANRLPDMVTALAAAQGGPPVETSAITLGGWTLYRHLTEGEAIARIQDQGPWDFVVLQEQSQTPLDNFPSMATAVGHFAPLITAAHAKMVLYMTWANPDASASDQDRLSAAYRSLGQQYGGLVAAVGEAFAAVHRRTPEEALWGPDRRHPSAAGTYLAAAVLLKTLEPVSLDNLPAHLEAGSDVLIDLPPDEAALLKAAAAETR